MTPTTDTPCTADHDGLCRCGQIVPCEESYCSEPAGHEYLCPKCLKAECGRPDTFDLACERRYDD